MVIGDISCILNEIGYNSIIERKTTTTYDPLAGNIVSWSTHLTILCAVENLSGNEIVKAEKLGVQATHRLYVNGIPDIKEQDRVLYQGVYYRITYVDNPMNVNDFLEIYLISDDNYVADSGE